MKEFKGTKGEWTATYRNSAGFEVYNEDNNIICSMGWYQFPSTIMNIEIEEANAKLIASAPELLKMLIRISKIENNAMKLSGFNVERLKKEVNEAISKALDQ